MVKIFIAICLSIFYCYSYGASPFSNTLDVYECATEFDAKNCTKCKNMKDVTLQVEVNVDKSVVIVTLYDDKKNIGSNALKNCKIVDKKNWICGNDGSYDQYQTFSQNLHTMTKGNYYSFSRYRHSGISSSNITPTNIEILSCAK